MHRRHLLLLLAAALTGCGGQGVPPGSKHLPASVATPPNDASLLRLLHTGGTAELLRANTLTPREWVITGGLPSFTRVLGAVADEMTVYALDNTGHLVAIDLLARRWRVVPTDARDFETMPDGTILGIDTSRHAVRVGVRGVTRLKATVNHGAVLLRGPVDDVITVGNRPGLLQVSGDAGELRHLEVPTGRVTTTWIGDLVAVVTDSGVTFADPTGRTERGRKPSAVHAVRVRGTPTAATFSPSGHRLYVGRKQGGLMMIDRFTRKPLRELPLPGAVEDLRVDRSGRWLLVRGATGNALWVVDLTRWTIVTTRVAPWSDNLPQVIDGRTLLVRSGSDLVAVDLDGDTSHNQGVLLGGAADLYLMLPWAPQSIAPTALASAPPAVPSPVDSASPPAATLAAPPPASTSTPEPHPATPPGDSRLYLQVSSSQNADWAKAFAQQLKDGGFPTRVLDPTSPTDGYRVVVGPFTSRVQADSVGKRLGRAYFIITPPGGDP